MIDLDAWRHGAGRFLEAMRVGCHWDFRFSPSSGPTLIGSAMAAMLAGLVGWTRRLSQADRDAWADRLCRCQRPDGWFEDDDVAEHNLVPGYGRDRALLHRTRHALMALEALGRRPIHRLTMIDPWLGRGAMTAWCRTLDLADYWYASNMMMDAAVLLLEAWQRWGQSGALEAVDELLDFCDAHIDARTGYHDAGRSETRNAMAGAMHLYPVYVVRRRPILHAEAAIRTTLGLQQPDGLFGYEAGTGGEDCLDYDAAIILSNLGLLHPAWREAITACFLRLGEALVLCRNADGGFAPHRRAETYYFGTRTTPVLPGQSSLWATYARLMTAVAIHGFLHRAAPAGWITGHNLLEVWDGGTGLCPRYPPGRSAVPAVASG